MLSELSAFRLVRDDTDTVERKAKNPIADEIRNTDTSCNSVNPLDKRLKTDVAHREFTLQGKCHDKNPMALCVTVMPNEIPLVSDDG